LLTDDDADDRFLFEKAIKEIPIATHLITVNNGEELMGYLSKNSMNLPDVLFLDLSMPRKTGYECLIEIKENKKLEAIPIVVFTTSLPSNIRTEVTLSNTMVKLGAQYYVSKPSDFDQLKHVIHEALIRVIEKVA